MDATLLLPLGAEAGRYELQLRDASMAARSPTTGEAQIKDSLTALRAPLDTAALPAGEYQLEVRPAGGEWRRVIVRVQ
jgi:hypothetical protein